MPGTAAYAAETKTFSILSFTGIFGLLALVAVVLRTYVRGSMLKCYGADDAVMGSAMVCLLLNLTWCGCFKANCTSLLVLRPTFVSLGNLNTDSVTI